MVVQLFSENVADFIRRDGRGNPVNTSNICNRFGWDTRDGYRRLLALEKQDRIKRVGAAPMEHGKTQNWLAV